MKNTDVLSERRAEKIIEQFENGSRNGEQWAHDVCLHRGTDKYEKSLGILNEAFAIKAINRRILALPSEDSGAMARKRMRR